MAAKEEKTADQLFEEMKSLAVEQQQCFYEILLDWTEYKFNSDPEKDEHKYLKQNIGYALFGPPTKNKEEINETKDNKHLCYATEKPNDTEADTIDVVDYTDDAWSDIENIYKSIRGCINMEADPSQSIDFGVIYNIMVYHNTNVESKKKEKVEEETKEETKEIKEEKISVVPIPIFKIRKSIRKKTVDNVEKPSTSTNNVDYKIWYIDTNARVYQSWSDYTVYNKLPKCIMVLPKDGSYQPLIDADYPIEEDYSTVWIEIINSPACSLTTKVCNNVDYVSNIIQISALGLSVAALFTPLAPVAAMSSAPAVGATVASCVWTVFRNTQELIDRNNHNESINPLGREAFPYWLGLTGSAVGLGANGASAIISKVAANGATIPTAAKVAFNTMQGGTLVLSGIGVAYMGYNMIEKYKETKTWDYLEALSLATHIMFFAGAVINVKFANDIIKESQGKFIEKYKQTRRSKNLRKKFNRAARKAAENNTCKISENAEVISFIKNRQDFVSFEQSISQTFDKTSNNIHSKWSFEHGKIKIGNIILIDPIEFAIRLISSGIFLHEPDQTSDPSDSQNNSNDSIFNQLKELLHDLLRELCMNADCPENIPTLDEFDQLLKDLNSLHINEECLRMLFNIVVMLMKYDKNRRDFFLVCFTFVWQYCKGNLKQWGIKTCRRMQSESGSYILRKIVIVLSEASDMILDNLATATSMYVKEYLRRC